MSNLIIGLTSYQETALPWLRNGLAAVCAAAGMVLLGVAVYWLHKTPRR